MVGDDFADDRGAGGVGALAERFEDGGRFGFRREDDEASLAGEVKRLEAEHAADAAYFGRDRDVGGIEADSDLALVGDLVQDGADAAACGVADHMDVARGVDHALHCTPERGAVAGDVRVDLEFVAGEQDGAAVAAHVAGHDHGVAGTRERAGGADALGELSDAGGGDEDVVDLALARDLGVARHDADARFVGGLLHGGGDLFELGEGEPLLDHERAGEIERFRAHAREVVDRAADAELADVAAGELERRHDESIRGERDLSGVHGQDRGVVAGEIRVGEMRLEDAVDEFGGLASARAVGERDEIVCVHIIHSEYLRIGSRRNTPLRWRPCTLRPGGAGCTRSRKVCSRWICICPEAPRRSGRRDCSGPRRAAG